MSPSPALTLSAGGGATSDPWSGWFSHGSCGCIEAAGAPWGGVCHLQPTGSETLIRASWPWPLCTRHLPRTQGTPVGWEPRRSFYSSEEPCLFALGLSSTRPKGRPARSPTASQRDPGGELTAPHAAGRVNTRRSSRVAAAQVRTGQCGFATLSAVRGPAPFTSRRGWFEMQSLGPHPGLLRPLTPAGGSFHPHLQTSVSSVEKEKAVKVSDCVLLTLSPTSGERVGWRAGADLNTDLQGGTVLMPVAGGS